ncbi:response regulator transcription factor [Achromobacter seleniivolatilans]|uniref:Response regulator transcription factor n=1 Tax=Achromobacter seleniivolatilans TaxID=3047478 RepID=A0ABY9LZU9_9BURK|nr:response regulator transcription factor [Achromobacter sp. R39]WMD20291.1 response regulator transcription factor [Achromobacter sp. R39]
MSANLLAPEFSLPAPVLLVEDEPMVCRRLEGLLAQLGYQPDALIFAASLAEARACLESQPVALALVDLGLPDGSGIELIAEMHAADPALAILVISAWCTEDAILAALRAGATGYVLKERDDIEVSLSLRSVLRGGAPIDPFVARRIIDELRPRPAEQSETSSDEILSPRENQILRLVAEGLANREIAEQLFLSRYTVECHIKHIYRKLAVSSRTRAVHAARSRGLLD